MLTFQNKTTNSSKMCSPTNTTSSSSTLPSSSSFTIASLSTGTAMHVPAVNRRRGTTMRKSAAEGGVVVKSSDSARQPKSPRSTAYGKCPTKRFPPPTTLRRIASDSRRTSDPPSRRCARGAWTTTQSTPNEASSTSPLTTYSTSFGGERNARRSHPRGTGAWTVSRRDCQDQLQSVL